MNYSTPGFSNQARKHNKPRRCGRSAGYAHATRRHTHQRPLRHSSSLPQPLKPPPSSTFTTARNTITLWRDIRSHPQNHLPNTLAKQTHRVHQLLADDLASVIAVYCALPMKEARLDLCRMIGARLREDGGGPGMIAALMADRGFWRLVAGRRGGNARKVVGLLMFGYTMPPRGKLS